MQIKEVLDEKVLLDMAQWGHKKIIDLLILRGVNVNARGSFGETALMMAAYWGHKEIVQLLLHKRADVNIRDNGGTTALMMAVVEQDELYAIAGGSDRLESVKLLIASGADVNIHDNCGKTALDYAEQSANKQIIYLLQRAGARRGTHSFH
ncbi:MAG: ankyrin repeat domain-containing protein [Spirochaetales bacterium]|nr:ankyrin repeat domain-containing protein [Spirochaetales bacterium]